MGKVEDRPSGEQADTVDGETDKDNPASAQEDVYERDQGATEVHTTQEPESETVPENYTICAPQLLHFDKEGHPLWFNGWILSNKYAEKSKREANTFERYMMEPDDARIGETDAWQLTGDNICCLTSDHSFSFSREDEETLKMIATLAKSAGAYGKT